MPPAIHNPQSAIRNPQLVSRDSARRDLYASAALAAIPRLLGAIDRNPFSPTYGCLDREFWHYRTASFPCGMHQEGVLPLALVYAHEFPGNRWRGLQRIKELAIAGLRFMAQSSHADGSCDDYYPFERALGAAVFSLQAAARAVELLAVNDAEIISFLQRRATWVVRHDESGVLANHHALAALGLSRVARLTGSYELHTAAEIKLLQVLSLQSDEGWFNEYGGADPGYQTVTIDCLAKLRRMTGDARLNEPLARAVAFARKFLHPDHSYGGEYGSRGTYHFYPHGCELLAHAVPDAADLADGFLAALATGKHAAFDDDRLYVHRFGNFLEAYVDWSPERAVSDMATDTVATYKPEAQAKEAPRVEDQNSSLALQACAPAVEFLPRARLVIRRDKTCHTVVSAARGGVFKHFDTVGDSADLPATDAGLILEATDGRVAVSQTHDLSRDVRWQADRLDVNGPLHWARFETATPFKQATLHLGMWTVGRWCRTLVRRLLQKRLITGRRPCPVRLHRTLEFLRPGDADSPRLRVTDRIQLTDPRLQIRRMAFGTDHQVAYVAASGVYQDSTLVPWSDLAEHVAALNHQRQITIVRVL